LNLLNKFWLRWEWILRRFRRLLIRDGRKCSSLHAPLMNPQCSLAWRLLVDRALLLTLIFLLTFFFFFVFLFRLWLFRLRLVFLSVFLTFLFDSSFLPFQFLTRIASLLSLSFLVFLPFSMAQVLWLLFLLLFLIFSELIF
jgi:hypothetical protein